MQIRWISKTYFHSEAEDADSHQVFFLVAGAHTFNLVARGKTWLILLPFSADLHVIGELSAHLPQGSRLNIERSHDGMQGTVIRFPDDWEPPFEREIYRMRRVE